MRFFCADGPRLPTTINTDRTSPTTGAVSVCPALTRGMVSAARGVGFGIGLPRILIRGIGIGLPRILIRGDTERTICPQPYLSRDQIPF